MPKATTLVAPSVLSANTGAKIKKQRRQKRGREAKWRGRLRDRLLLLDLKGYAQLRILDQGDHLEP